MWERIPAGLLLAYMAILAGGAAWRESVTFDEVTHIGAGVSYLQKLDLRLNQEHPPLTKALAAVPLVLGGVHADYSSPIWTVAERFSPGYMAQWIFGDWLLNRWNRPVPALAWARVPMLLLTLLLGWTIYALGRRLGGPWGGLLCLAVYAGSPVFLAFGPLVLTDTAVTLFSLLTVWSFAELWQDPSRKRVWLFALSLAGALLSKFSSGLLLVALAAFAVSARKGAPWRAAVRGILRAALVVYGFYLLFSWNQPANLLPVSVPLERLLMPVMLYGRGVAVMLLTASRATFILGHHYAHGVWFYFPALLILKSALGFLALLGVALVTAVVCRGKHKAIPSDARLLWRMVWVSLAVVAGASMASRLNISFRHFSFPVVLLILMLAPLPRMVEQRSARALVALLAASCLFTAARAYPYYLPYANALGLGRPAYTLFNDSNLDWNQGLPEVERFAREHGLRKVLLDPFAITDPAPFVPEAQLWNCQTPAASDGGEWAVVSANMILDARNCQWLMRHPHLPLAGGSMYAVRLPSPIPPEGAPDGPPAPRDRRNFLGMEQDLRALYAELARHPEAIAQRIDEMAKKARRGK